MYTLKFKKYEDKKWHIELPDWKGPHENLQMVVRADKLCEEVAYRCGSVDTAWVKVHTSNNHKPVLHWHFDILLIKYSEDSGGAYYNVCGADTPNIWISPVTLAVFGEYPDYIQLFPTTIKEDDKVGLFVVGL